MKQLITVLVAMLCFILSHAQPTAKPATLYGKTTVTALKAEPFNKWFDSTYRAYVPKPEITQEIKATGLMDLHIEVFYGTWCGDSRREVPAMLKLLDDCRMSKSQVSLIALGGSDSLYKQSPAGEEKDKGIFRVPVFIVYKKGAEIGRINEYPAVSLEYDFLTIIKGKPYTPNYKSFEKVNEWLTAGVLADKNASTRGLAMQLKWLVANEHELNSLGYLLLKQNKKAEAMRIFQVNAILYPESANVLSSLGEGYLENGDKTMAIVSLERSLLLNKDAALQKGILAALYKAKGLSE